MNTRQWRHRLAFFLLLALLVVYAIAITYPILDYDPTGDPAQYVVIADNIRQTGCICDAPDSRWVTEQSNIVTVWAPLYMILLALSPDTAAMGMVINALSLVMTGLAAWVMLRELDVSFPIALTAIVLLLLLLPRPVYREYRTDPLFLALMAMWLLYLLRDANWTRHVLMSLLLSAMVMTRYAGVVFIGVSFLVLWRQSWRTAIAVCALPSALLGMWLARNLLIAGVLTAHPEARTTLPAILSRYFGVTSQWILPIITIFTLVALAQWLSSRYLS